MWYYMDGEKEIGPVSQNELQQLFKERKIDLETAIRKTQSKEWMSLGDVARVKRQSKGDDAIQTSSAPESISSDQDPVDKEQAPANTASNKALENIPLRFTGTGGEYFKIWIVNMLLTIITFGIYSAWAKVRKKQYFYGNTQIVSNAFQYLADPIKILKGRAIVFIGYIIYSIISSINPIAGLVMTLALLPALPWFIIRALAFNTRNSAIRNIKFNFHGTYWQAAKVFILFPLLIPFTLGLILPYFFYQQKKFIVENSSYGTAQFDFQASGKDYYKLFLGLLLPLVICIATIVAVNYFLPQMISPFAMVVFYLYVMAYISVRGTNLLFNSSHLSDHNFKADMRIREFIGIVITNTIATVLTLGLFYPFAIVRAYRYRIEHLTMVSAGNLNQFVAAEQKQVSALGDEFSDFMDFDIGL